ncbi:hypothetical protein [Pedobacter nutrimenti]|uniref:hypothetical protein n=1 Tax=Pedobacter nutrimenti TaxID=1241337 RepID=UPI00292FCD0A|nr:hypothetical protein [Pedobacter nutrimenti]
MLSTIGKKEFGFIFSILAVGIICAGLINTRLLKHFEIKTITKFALITQLIAGAGMILVIYFNGSFAILFLLTFIFLAMLGSILPNTTALYLASLPTAAGSASALVGSVSYLSAFLITSLLSLLHNNTTYPMVFIMWSCTIVALSCLLYRKNNYN